MRLARAYDESDETAQVFRRVVTPAAKFWICKRTPFVTLEAMEVLGGSGYIEESIMPRLYREAPVNSIWEGSGNVDVPRRAARDRAHAECGARCCAHELDGRRRCALEESSPNGCKNACAPPTAMMNRKRARWYAIWCWRLQAALLIKHSPPAVADAFCASRLGGEGGGAFGTLPRGLDLRAIASAPRPLELKASRISPAPAPPAPGSRP